MIDTKPKDWEETEVGICGFICGRERLYAEDLYRYIQTSPPLADVSPEWRQEYLPTPIISS